MLKFYNQVSLYKNNNKLLNTNLFIDNKTRWSSIYNILKNFLNLKKSIKTVINISNSKAFKSRDLLLSKTEYKYLEDCLLILKIFVLVTTKLQRQNYSTIYYTILFIY